MHEPMMKNPIIKESIAKLEKLGVKFVEGKAEESKVKLASAEQVLHAVVAAMGERSNPSSDELESLGFFDHGGPDAGTHRSGEVYLQSQLRKNGGCPNSKPVSKEEQRRFA